MTSKFDQALFDKFKASVPDLIKEADYDELYGQQLDPTGQFYNAEKADKLLIKLMDAYGWNLEESKTKLLAILKWRKSFNPLSAAFNEKHEEKLNAIAVITYNKEGKPREKIINWNLYGRVTPADAKAMFGDTAKFLRWRVGIMEQAIQLLDFATSDNDYMVQVHDYKGVSLFKMDPDVKRGSRSVIETFSNYYPELLSKKFFVNVPTVMLWVYNLVKTFVPSETRKKFVLLGDASNLNEKLGSHVPQEYGGKTGPLESQRFLFSDKTEISKSSSLTPYTAYILEKNYVNELD